jgi:anaerobic selenocysteine-containing dehydrogenase
MHGHYRNLLALKVLTPDPVLEMPYADAQARAIAHGDWVEVRTGSGGGRQGGHRCRARAGAVFGQHGWWAAGAAGTPYDEAHPLAANVNNVIATDRADPVSGSIPLRRSPCEVVKITP